MTPDRVAQVPSRIISVQELALANAQTNAILAFMAAAKHFRLVEGWPEPPIRNVSQKEAPRVTSDRVAEAPSVIRRYPSVILGEKQWSRVIRSLVMRETQQDSRLADYILKQVEEGRRRA